MEDSFENAAEEFAKKAENADNIGKAEMFKKTERELGDDRPLMADIGMKNINMDHLPSRGHFYPQGTQIAIRAASVSEIRHWSTLDDADLNSVDDMLNYVIERCCQLKIPGSSSSWRDIKDIDRFYIIFAIREFTFKDGENKIYVNAGNGDKIEVHKDMIQYFTLDEKLAKYYDVVKKRILLELKTGEKVPFYIPSIGVTQFIKGYVRGKRQQQANIDEAFVQFASFIFEDWRQLNQGTYERAVQDSSMWSLKKISLLAKVTEMLKDSVDPKVQYETPAGESVSAPLNIEGGIKSLFLISNIFDELV